MADKAFGVKDINLIGASGTPTIESPNNLNINAVNVAISTDITVAGKVSLGAGTSISSPAANTLTLGTNSVERLRINSSGYVGIGTDNPGYKLDVRPTPSDPTSGSPPAGAFLQIRADDATVGSGPSLVLSNFGGSKETAWRISAVSTSGNNGDLIFNGYAGGATYPEVARFTSAGNLKFPSGAGIDFSARTPDSSGTVSSEILDDYEEGTFTPSFIAGTVSGGYTRQEGRYTKVGRLVTFTLVIDGNGNLQGAAQQLLIGGLPFTSENEVAEGAAMGGYPGNFDTTNNRRFWRLNLNSTQLQYLDASANAVNGNAVTDVNSQLNLCGFYFTDS